MYIGRVDIVSMGTLGTKLDKLIRCLWNCPSINSDRVACFVLHT